MNFGIAFDGIFDGHKASRLGWGDHIGSDYIYNFNGYLTKRTESNRVQVYRMTEEDILAEDWFVIED